MEAGDICPDCELIGLPGALCQKHAAANDLLAACEKYRTAQQHFQGCHQCGADLGGNVWYCTDYHRLLNDAVQTADAAVAKAKGA